MQNETLFGHLANQFSHQPENLATESLYYLLKRSNNAKKVLIDLLSDTKIDLPSDLNFQTQVSGDDHSIPDLVGRDINGDSVVIIESKFWAGLTEHQPTTYLKRLLPEKDGILVFIAPSLRFDTLWAELLRRCKINGIDFQEPKQLNNEFLYTRLNKNHVLSLISWRQILSKMVTEFESASQNQLMNDAIQLKGLCDEMDTEAFLPIQSQELSSSIGTRIYEYCELVNIVTDKLRALKICSTKGLKTSAGFGYYGRYMRITDKYGCALRFDAEMWSDYRETPLWFLIYEIEMKKWIYPTNAKRLLKKLEFENPSRLIDDPATLYIPIFLLTGVEQDEVVDHIIVQINEIAELLKG